MTERARTAWTEQVKPKCWDDAQAWHDWMQGRGGACSPCVDCTPAYRESMRAQLRCERPEVVFIRLSDGEVSGLCADDPAYARLLMGLKVGVEVIGRGVEPTARWAELLKFVRRRCASRDVKRAIAIWLKRFNGKGDSNGKA